MSEETKLLTVKTKMEKEDYRKFLYLATFRRNKLAIPMIFVIGAIGAIFIAIHAGSFSLTTFLISWVLLTLLAFGVIIFKVEQRNKQRIKTDNTGAFGALTTLDFFDEHLIVTTECFDGKSDVKYEQIFRVLETQDYFITYFSANSASLIRKVDMSIEDQNNLKGLLQDKLVERYKKI